MRVSDAAGTGQQTHGPSEDALVADAMQDCEASVTPDLRGMVVCSSPSPAPDASADLAEPMLLPEVVPVSEDDEAQTVHDYQRRCSMLNLMTSKTSTGCLTHSAC